MREIFNEVSAKSFTQQLNPKLHIRRDNALLITLPRSIYFHFLLNVVKYIKEHISNNEANKNLKMKVSTIAIRCKFTILLNY